MLEATVDKFIFRIPETLRYSDPGIWVSVEGSRARLGLSDFAQQVSGDIAFASVAPAGTDLRVGDEFASLETVKVNVGLLSPVTGRILEVNPLLQDAPELINRDPYDKGWIMLIELADWEADRAALLDAPNYLQRVVEQARAESKP